MKRSSRLHMVAAERWSRGESPADIGKALRLSAPRVYRMITRLLAQMRVPPEHRTRLGMSLWLQIKPDLSIPEFLRVKSAGLGVKHSGERVLEEWEITLSKVEPRELREFIAEAMRRGRFSRRWLVATPWQPDSAVQQTLAYWRGMWEESVSEPATRAAEAKARRAAERGQVQPPAELPADAIIEYVGVNPKKAGSAAHDRWALLMKHHGKTVGKFLGAEGNSVTLANAIKSGRVTLTTKETRK